MAQRDLLTKLRLDDADIASRMAFFELTREDLERLAGLRAFAEQHTDAIVEAFYDLLLRHPETRKFFPDETTVRRVKRLQHEYFLGLFGGTCDRAYVEHRAGVGAAHERIGMAPKWYLGAYRRYLQLLHDRLFAYLPDAAAADAAFQSAAKLVFFDMSIAIDTYNAANLEALKRHQAAIRELSTPVIRVHDRVLLLPLVGTVDSARAHQIMETVLLRVTEDQAKVLILDIAGVPVVDTKVAQHLLQTTAAVKLVGARTILTGISAQVARTIIQLGVDISAMDTQSRLQDGIELALSLVGKAITAKGA
ncbi:MAG: protoglobin domain-containing protein [Minicystis sp.]